MEPDESVEAAYRKILIVALFESFDSRRYLEQEVINHLPDQGDVAVAMTAYIDSRMPINQQRILDVVEEVGADAVLVTQITSLQTKTEATDMRPETTVNIRPTWYFNLWSVETTEYIEPQGLDFEFDMLLLSELYSVSTRDKVWAMESKSKIYENQDTMHNYEIYVDEANAIAKQLVNDGLVDR